MSQSNQNGETEEIKEDEEDFFKPRKYVVNCFHCSCSVHDNSSSVEVRRYDKCFYLTMEAEDFVQAPHLQQQYLSYLNAERMDATEDTLVEDYNPEDFNDWALEPCLELFETLAPAPEQKAETSLYDQFHPTCFYYALRVVEGKLTPVPRDKRGAGTTMLPGMSLDPAVFSPKWPSHSWKDISVPPSHPDEVFNTSNKVVVLGTPYFFKQYSYNDTKRALREISNYKRISESPLAPDVRICRLEGLARDDEDMLIGLLLSYVDCRFTTLSCAAGNPEASTSKKQKWVEQVREIVLKLHEAGIVWGDVKPDNVLIDMSGDAWVIDFGGGYTRGFVDKEKAGTVEGDLQGLERIVEYCSK